MDTGIVNSSCARGGRIRPWEYAVAPPLLGVVTVSSHVGQGENQASLGGIHRALLTVGDPPGPQSGRRVVSRLRPTLCVAHFAQFVKFLAHMGAKLCIPCEAAAACLAQIIRSCYN